MMLKPGLMWTEKYRPQSFETMVNQKDIVAGVSSMIKEGNIPHMIFAGPAGVGKTTMALCVAREIHGDRWREETLELNASDDRGIGMVRDYVKGFALAGKLDIDKSANKPKLVILDEADEMTNEAQSALRRIIEDGARQTRFIILCNNLSQLIVPIQSRCVVFRFSRLSKEDIAKHLATICEKEAVKYDMSVLNSIHDMTLGDVRHSVNVLQTIASLGEVNTENMNVAVGKSARDDVRDILHMALAGKLVQAQHELMKVLSSLTAADFIKYISLEARDHPAYGKITTCLAEYEYRITYGSNPEIQLTGLLADLVEIGGKKC